MQYLLSHRTSYSYVSSVDSAHHIAHLRARPFPGQKVTSIDVTTSPDAALAVQHLDHFGNHIDILRVEREDDRVVDNHSDILAVSDWATSCWSEQA